MPTIAFNIRQPEAVAHELGEANARLARESGVPGSIVELIEDLAATISEADTATIATIDPYLWIQIQAAALRARNAVGADDGAKQRRAVRVALEQVRFLFARLAERQPVAEDRPIKDVLAWLDESSPFRNAGRPICSAWGSARISAGSPPTRPRPPRPSRNTERVSSRELHRSCVMSSRVRGSSTGSKRPWRISTTVSHSMSSVTPPPSSRFSTSPSRPGPSPPHRGC
jgi:hypothetical protein